MKLVTVIKGKGQAPDNYAIPEAPIELISAALSHTYGVKATPTDLKGNVFVLTEEKIELPREPQECAKHPYEVLDEKIGELTEVNRQLTDALMQIAGLTTHYFNSPLHANTPEIYVAHDANIIANEVLRRLQLGGI